MKDFSGRASRTQLDRWFAAIQAGLADENPPALRTPHDGPPPPRVWIDRNPVADARLKRARAAVTDIAGELNLPVENLLTPELLRRVIWSPPDPVDAASIGSALAALGVRPWQVEATAQAIADAFVEPDQPAPEPDESPS